MSETSLPVWNLRAVIWFHFSISSLILLPSPITFSVFVFFLLMARSFFLIIAHSPDFFFQKTLNLFRNEIVVVVFLVRLLFSS